MTWTSATLVDRLGGDEQLARELVTIFLTEYPKMLDAVRGGVAAGDAATIARAVHAFKGSIANFVDEGPVRTARALEQAACEGRLRDVQPLLQRLEAEVEALVEAMRHQGGATCAS
jgi:HPt (histidine-containing phosphotransfer) domain-containing protein